MSASDIVFRGLSRSLLAAAAAWACGGRPADAGPAGATGADSASPLAGAEAPTVPPAPSGGLVVSAPDLAGLVSEAWYGVYLSGSKVGHVRRAGRLDGPEGAPWELSLTLTLSMGGAGRELRVDEVRRYADSPPYALMETEYAQRGTGFEETRRAVRVGAAFEVTRRLGSEAPAPPRSLPASGETILSQLMQAPPRLSLLGPERRGAWPVWSWEQQRDHTVSVAFKGARSEVRAGVTQEVIALDLTSTEVPLPGTAEVGAGGLLLRSTLGSGLELRLEEKAVAQSAVAGLDLAAEGLRSPVALGASAGEGALRFTLKLPAGLEIPPGPGQTVERAAAGEVVVTRRRQPLPEVLDATARAAMLASEGEVDHAHPSITAKKTEILAGVEGARAQAAAIVRWVAGTLRKELATHLPAASVVLSRGVGDCTEHAWLAVALMRAAGIPARPVYGVAWGGAGAAGAGGTFAFHAWIEAWFDGAWHAMDPTWGQETADATHLRFGASVADVAAFLHGVEITAIATLPE